MRYKISKVLLSLCLCGCAHAQTPLLCPDKILPTGVELNPAVKAAGWDYLASDMPIWLTNLSVYDGPVIQNAALEPNEKSGKEEIWNFKAHPGVKFLSCEYANGAFKLFKPLPDGLTACRVNAQKSSSTGKLQGGFICW